MTKLEVLITGQDGPTWISLAEAKEGAKMTKKGEQVVLDWTTPDGLKVKSVYNLNNFLGYTVV